MVGSQLYDTIGHGYSGARLPDPRIEAQVLDALGDVQTVINVGAGTGNYEPTDRLVVAVEPNETMIEQRSSDAPVVQAFAEALPVGTNSFDAALAMFTIHHWTDQVAGLREMRRVARRQVALVYDTDVTDQFWLHEYFPKLKVRDQPVTPHAAWIATELDLIDSRPLLIPHDCIDGFTGAFWNRPELYLDDAVQAGMSTLARMDEAERRAGTDLLRDALASGAWDERHGHLRADDWFDIGYRLVICGR